MSTHQVVTGALNKGENVFAIGSVEGITFTVCAVGSDVVILGADFHRVQIIPGSSLQTGRLVSSVSSCSDSGKIAATYGQCIRIFEPVPVNGSKESSTEFPYKWIETQCFSAKGLINTVLWNMDGLRMLIVLGDELLLYQHKSLFPSSRPGSSQPVMFCIAEEDHGANSSSWDPVWSTHLSHVPNFIRYSPDGLFLAVAGENDASVKVFYQDTPDRESKEQLTFSFVTLHHPAPVKGLEWRRTGRYMPRKCVLSVLMTWCTDNTSRIWRETPPPVLSIIDISGDGGEPVWEQSKPKKLFGKHIHVKKTRKKIVNRIRGLVPEKKRLSEEKESGIGLRAQIGRTPSLGELHVAHHSHADVQFHLAATINADTDCLLVPVMGNGDELQKPFCVHWLNNKELVFSIGAERLLTEALISDGEQNRASLTELSPASAPESPDQDFSNHHPNGVEHQDKPTSVYGSVCSETASSKDILDVKLEILLRQWGKSSDVLFTIHPVDGSLLVWTVEWLDDLHRQPVISFTSRFPGAFPITDASSLLPTLNTFNPNEPLYVDMLRTENDSKEIVSDHLLERVSKTVHVLTNHENGSLNLWHMAMDDNSDYSTIINITHISRMCGHRFQINEVVAHPVLPLLLTSSQFRAGDADELTLDALSEVILWKIAPVGPLCKSGGVRELARVASPSRAAFSSLSWIPVILPSCTLGTVCNSPSSCFVASDGCNLVIYQAVVDARGLLSELYDYTHNQTCAMEDDRGSLLPSPRKAQPTLLQQFDVVSKQSTAKPGCVLQVGRIDDVVLENSPLHLLHVFNESLVIDGYQTTHDDNPSRMGAVVDRSHSNTFTDRFSVVIVEKGTEYDSFVMYSLEISSQQPQPIPQYDIENLPDEKGFVRPASPLAHSVGRLHFESKLVCRQEVPLPSGVRIVSAAPAAGHLPSSTIYPACQTPYVLMTSGNDDVVRFWKCEPTSMGEVDSYKWSEWNMISNSRPSELEVEGSVLSISAAHSGRIACAYDPRCGGSVASSSQLEIAVFECESSGGVEWMREDTLSIKEISLSHIMEHRIVGKPLRSSITDISTASRILNGPSDDALQAVHDRDGQTAVAQIMPSLRDMIRLDWVSTEDGGHILTVGVASNVYLYTQISQDTAQQNVVLMKESESSLRRPSLRKMSSFVGHSQSSSRLTCWVCIRKLELQSVDGLAPIPTTLSWARDGLLVVGMQSEMRVYNQWNLKPKSSENNILIQNMNNVAKMTSSASHAVLDKLHKKDLPSVKSRLRIETNTRTHKDSDPQSVLDALAGEGLFEAARLSSPILPQYHPKQLIVLLNAGKTKRVKAILLHVLNSLKEYREVGHSTLSRVSSIRRMSTTDNDDGATEQPRAINVDEESLDYYEIDDIAPLPLHALISADNADVRLPGEKAEAFGKTPGYDSLFCAEKMDDDELDNMLKDSDSVGGRSRNHSGASDTGGTTQHTISVTFTAKHNRSLTELLTHTHLPGLSSVDQMHLLAIADTLSHFSNDVMDKLTQANAALQPAMRSVLGDATAGGYAAAAAGVETVDECGLRYLMAMKQHEYLLLCLPPQQRMDLKRRGLSSAHIIWAQHSETETELLNAIPVMQKANPTWNDLRSLGAAWWLKSTASLKICVEKLAKAAYQLNQDPMDASLYYLALKKKNVLTHLFKSSRNQPMASFFANDFNEDHWKKVAAKNAFVLMSKQRFEHAAAFFLLSGSLKDAIQTILCKCNDLQLAMVVVRLYESDIDSQMSILKEMMCREVLGQSAEEFDSLRGKTDDDYGLSREAHRDPFERSMAYWCLKDYSRAARTLVEEADGGRPAITTSLSDIFNFYTFLRKHPLVVRQRLTDSGAQVGSTEQFIAVGKQLETLVTPSERRLFFRTAAEHMARGCPMLALEVLSRLPRNLTMVHDGPGSLKMLLQGQESATASEPVQNVEAVDWSQPTKVEEETLDLGWSDEDNDDLDEFGETVERKADASLVANDPSESGEMTIPTIITTPATSAVDIIAQHLKFVASLRILTEELSTLASGFEVDGGQLRYQLFTWMEKEVEVLKMLCDYRSNTDPEELEDDLDVSEDLTGDVQSLHDALRTDHVEMIARLKILSKRRKWLSSNQKLLRSFTSYCALHSAQNHRLTSALMELLLLLLEIQKDTGVQHLSEAVPDMNSFPLLEASVSSTKMFVSSPLTFIENQCHDILDTIVNISSIPSLESNIQKSYMTYNLSQGLSSCLYQSLCDVDNFNLPVVCRMDGKPGVLTRRLRLSCCVDDIKISSSPSKWPGVDNLVAMLGREKDDDAPQLRLLLVESFIAITMALFTFALSANDSRWLYRLAAHHIDDVQFGLIFGGGGSKKMKAMPPNRPPRPPAPSSQKPQSVEVSAEGQSSNNEAGALRSKLHSRVFGAGHHQSLPSCQPVLEQTISRWVPPRKNIVQLFSAKPSLNATDSVGVDYDSDNEDEASEVSIEDEDECEYAQVSSYAWLLLRLAAIEQQSYRMRQFLGLSGYDPTDIPSVAPRIEAVFRLLDGWSLQMRQYLRTYPGGCPVDLIPNIAVDQSDSHLGPSAKKYASLLESGNTPFESDHPHVLPVKRLWSFLVREPHLQNIFISHVYSSQTSPDQVRQPSDINTCSIDHQAVPDAFKIIQKDNEPIVAFACNQNRPGLLVVSNGRELQEMDISSIFEDVNNSSSWLYNRAELDVQLFRIKRDPLKDNDDYQLFTDGASPGAKHVNMRITPWIVDRSRKGLVKMLKRTASGIRRIDSHPSAPFYVTGSTDGSIRVWEWGVGQPVYTARVAGQHAKVTKITFSCNGNKFAAVDGDGMLCLWQACHATEQKKPYFSQRCHNKSATDVRFLGHSSSVLLTAGASTGDYNLGLWDTLLPQNRALVHSWVAHPEGATCAMYLPNNQTIVSGGRHGDICLWDVRQRQLRSTIKAFEPQQMVKTIVTDFAQDLIIVGSSEGDIKIWSADSNLQLMYALPGEHSAKSGFSFRQVSQSSVQGIQQLYVDQNMRMFSCGADSTLKFRTLPSVYNLNVS